MNDIKSCVSERLKKIRSERNVSQIRFAEELGISPRTLQSYELAKVMPGSEVLAKFYGLGYNINWILSGEGEMRKGAETVTELKHLPTSELDEELLTLVIERVEARLISVEDYPVAKKAQLIGLIYEEVLCQERESGIQTDSDRVDRVIRFSFAS